MSANINKNPAVPFTWSRKTVFCSSSTRSGVPAWDHASKIQRDTRRDAATSELTIWSQVSFPLPMLNAGGAPTLNDWWACLDLNQGLLPPKMEEIIPGYAAAMREALDAGDYDDLRRMLDLLEALGGPS